jgi:formylglycine-generating enzyme required for sulfatase activity
MCAAVITGCKRDTAPTQAPKTKQVDVAWLPGQPKEPAESGPKCRKNGLDNRPGCGAATKATAGGSTGTADGFEAEELKGQRRRKKARAKAAVPPEEHCPPELSRMQVVSIPAERFSIGCDDPDHCGAHERPARERVGKPFSIHRTEVTQGAYQRCVETGACTRPAVGFGPQAGYEPLEHCTMPVASVTWEQADAYCRWAGMRLPTEEEWEHAARGSDGRTYPWGEAEPSCAQANFEGCGGRVRAVGSHAEGASPFGLWDMAGNVREWLADTESGSDPNSRHGRRAIRGGMFTDDADKIRSARRTFGDVEATDRGLGMRCAK